MPKEQFNGEVTVGENLDKFQLILFSSQYPVDALAKSLGQED